MPRSKRDKLFVFIFFNDGHICLGVKLASYLKSTILALKNMTVQEHSTDRVIL